MAEKDLNIQQLTPEELTPDFINTVSDDLLKVVDIPTLTKAAANLSRRGYFSEADRLFNLLQKMGDELDKSLYSEKGDMHQKMLYYMNVDLLGARISILNKKFDEAKKSYHNAIKKAELISLSPEKYIEILEESLDFLKKYNLEDSDAEIIEEKLQKAKRAAQLEN